MFGPRASSRFAWTLVLASTCLGIASFTSAAHANEPAPIVVFNPDDSPPPSTRAPILLLGAAVTGVFYGAAAGASQIWSEDPGANDLLIPVAGPWMKLGRTTLCNDDTGEGCSDFFQVAGAVLVVLDGLGQAGGIALLVEGTLFRGATTSARTAASATRTSQGRSSLLSPLGFALGDATITPVPYLPRISLHSREVLRASPALPHDAQGDVGFGFVGTF